MNERYGYIDSRVGRSPRRRRPSRGADVLGAVLLLLVAAGLVYGGYRAFSSLRPKGDDYATWSLHRAREIVEIGNDAARLRGKGQARSFASELARCRQLEATIAATPFPDGGFERHAALYGVAMLLTRAASEAAANEDYLAALREARAMFLRWKELARKELPANQLKALDIDLALAVPKAPQPAAQQKPVRRGVALISLSTLPRPTKKLPGGAYVFALADVMSVTVEVQNQGEATEATVTVVLTVRSDKAGEVHRAERTIENLKPGERRPVTFENVLPDASPDAENVIKVVAGPVPGEKYLFNNEKTLRFRWE